MLRTALKAALPRLARSSVGKHVIHAATAGDRGALRFGTVDDWPHDVQSFEDLDFLFTSSQLNHGIVSLRFDEAALLFRVVRSLGPARIVELGRYRGGSTFLMAVAMADGSTLRSIDLHVATEGGATGAELDRELRAALDRYALAGVELEVADTRKAPLPDDPVDVLFIDADHRYEGARADFDRWSPLVRPGGLALLHDAVDTGGWGTVYPGVARLCAEIDARDARFARASGAGTIAVFRRQDTTDT